MSTREMLKGHTVHFIEIKWAVRVFLSEGFGIFWGELEEPGLKIE